ncbi:MAG: hypothetical protein ACOZNI_17355, partial [Myxococcota bacterium]
MAQKDQELAPKQGAKAAKAPAPQAKAAPLPDAKQPVQQGNAADLQRNVGNAGVKEMIEKEAGDKADKTAPAKNPAEMSKGDLAKSAKADAKKLAETKKSGGKKAEVEKKKIEAPEKE